MKCCPDMFSHFAIKYLLVVKCPLSGLMLHIARDHTHNLLAPENIILLDFFF